MRLSPRFEAHWQQLDWFFRAASKVDPRVSERLRRWRTQGGGGEKGSGGGLMSIAAAFLSSDSTSAARRTRDAILARAAAPLSGSKRGVAMRRKDLQGG